MYFTRGYAPMSLFESNGRVSLSALFQNSDLDIVGVVSDLSVEQVVFAACRGGWPSTLKKKTERAMLFETQNYVANFFKFTRSKTQVLQTINLSVLTSAGLSYGKYSFYFETTQYITERHR